MIRIEATREIMFCMIGALIPGLIAGCMVSSFMVGAAVFLALFCILLDWVFSYEVEDDGDWNEDI